MNKSREKKDHEFCRKVKDREKRKLRSRRQGRQNVWFGLGAFGLVGWSIALPTVAGVFLGAWIDLSRPGAYSWTLMLLAVGLVTGCFNAWYWIQRERKAISRERDENGC